MGPDFWADTALRLPPGMGADAAIRNVFTGERLIAEAGPAGPRLSAGTILANFPVALLEAVA
jgi:maltooligosyltrehalose synthase